MSVHIIYYKDGAKMMRPVLTEAEYRSLRGSARQQEVLKAVHKGDMKAKQNLVQMNYSCLPNDDGTLKGSTRMSTTVGMDIDHIPQGELQAVRERILSMKDELGLLMLELSARGEGYHLVFRRRPELSQEENLRWAANLLGVEFDKGAKDITRVFFTTTEKELLFLSPQLFELKEVERVEFSVESQLKVESGKDPLNSETTSNSKLTDNSKLSARREAALSERSGERTLNSQLNYHGIPYSKIVDAWLDGKQVKAGDRHRTSLILADHLRYITDNDGALIESILRDTPFVQEIVRERGENVAQTVKSAQGFEFLKGIPKRLQEALRRAGVDSDEDTAASDGIVSPSGDDRGAPVMPKRLPKLIQLLTSKTPDIYKPAVSHAVFPALGAHLCKTRFRYIDNVEHEATLMNVLMAGTGAGKDCISGPINHIMADIRRRDAENLAREKAWKDEVNRRGANKDKRQRPEGLVIQEIDADMTGPAFVMRMAEADEHFLYTKLNEIDQFDALKGNGRGGQQFQIMCLAFDPDNRYGQTRVGTQSVTEKVCVRFNWNATTTILKGQRYFQNVLTDGPISRINFCTIPEREIGADIPIYGTYDAEFDEELRPYIERLCAARGTIDCPQAFKLAKKLKEECADFARLSQSRTYENLSFRALVIAYLKACVLFVANNYRWDKTMEDFIRWSLQYDLWCKMQFFGEAIEQANNDTTSSNRRGPRNLLELLPNVFTIDDARRVRQKQGLSNEYKKCRKMIDQWVSRKYVTRVTDYSFKKCQ